MSRKEISELLKLTGWSQRTLADKLRVHEAAVSRWISGERTPGGPACQTMEHFLAKARTKLAHAARE